jgi:hypothetical protein
VALLLFGLSFWLVGHGMTLLRSAGECSSSVTFRRINIYMLLVMALLSVDRLFG